MREPKGTYTKCYTDKAGYYRLDVVVDADYRGAQGSVFSVLSNCVSIIT